MPYADTHCLLLMAGSGWSVEETRLLISLWGEANAQSQLDRVSRKSCNLQKNSPSRESKQQDVGAMESKNKEPYTKVQEGTSLVCTTPSFPSAGLYRVAVSRPCACHDIATSSPAQRSRLV